MIKYRTVFNKYKARKIIFSLFAKISDLLSGHKVLSTNKALSLQYLHQCLVASRVRMHKAPYHSRYFEKFIGINVARLV